MMAYPLGFTVAVAAGVLAYQSGLGIVSAGLIGGIVGLIVLEGVRTLK